MVTHGKNRYGRVIADVFVGGKPVNEIMVRQGWAWNFVKYSRSPHLAELERQARAERRGLWGSPGVRPSSAAHNAVGLAGESPVVGIDCLPT